MTLPALLARAKHVHVTERESAHRWPNGRYDDGAWEDCTFVSGLELARICHNTAIPATHYEEERLRQAAGKGPLGGSNANDLMLGYARRYGWHPAAPLSGFPALWAALTPGRAAMSQGGMGAFPWYHRLRRWDRGFSGRHAVFIARVDATDRVWWCDPLAPVGTYQGEWVTKAELKKYVEKITGERQIVAVIRQPKLPDTSTAPAPAPAPVSWITQEPFVSYPVPKTPQVCTIPKGTRLYARSALIANSRDIIISAARTMPYLGAPSPAARVVEYVNGTGVHSGRSYFIKAAAATSIRPR